VVKAPDDKILVIKRRGKWDLPKGKIEPGESNEEGALREVEEECGISNLELKKLITTTYHTYTLNNEAILKRTFWYDMEHSSNSKLTPQTEEEISEVKWLSENDINMVLKNTFPSIIEVLKKGDFLNNNIY
nr:NUDIX domain-containing protein [Bacteroidales bacterium]